MHRKNFLAQLDRKASFAPISFGYRKFGIQIRYQVLYAWVYYIGAEQSLYFTFSFVIYEMKLFLNSPENTIDRKSNKYSKTACRLIQVW